MIRLIATDVDGTLVPDGTHGINPEYFPTLLALREMGIQIAAASGRQYDSLVRLFAPVRDELFYISNNGAVMSTGSRHLFVRSLPAALQPELMADLNKLADCWPVSVGTDGSYYLRGTPGKLVHWLRDEYRCDMFEVEGWEGLPPFVKIAVYHDPDLGPHPAEVLIDRYRGRLTGVVSGIQWVDFMACGMSKGRALQDLQESLGILPEETMAFGDQMNDLTMLARASYSIAVGSARPEVRAAAVYTAAPLSEDGVLQVLKSLVARGGEFSPPHMDAD